jgi:ubiquinone/menaquinone biosynthesis C-methylase UbiE
LTYRRRSAPGLLAGHAILVMLASVACLRSAQADPAATPVPDAQPAVVIATGGAPAATPSVKHHTRRHGAHEATDAARGPHDATARHAFDDVAHWSRVFDDPERDAWQKPAELVAALGLAPGATVADLGAGTGYFARHLVNAVGPRGTVLAADTEPALVEHLRRRAEQEGFANLVPILASADNPRLPTGTSDVVLIVDTWHHIDDRVAYARRLSSALATTGRVVIVDWQKHDLPVGPPPDHKLAREQVIDELTQAGYRLVAEPDVLPYQYVLVFAPAAQ